MNRFLFAVLFLSTSIFTSFLANELGHASLVRWAPGVVTPKGSQKSNMPVWATIAFDKQVSLEYATKFCNQMYSINKEIPHGAPRKHGKYPNHFVLVVSNKLTENEIKNILDQTNRYFDPEIEKQEQRAATEAKEKAEKATQEKKAMQLALLQKEKDTEQKKQEEKLKQLAIDKANAEKILNEAIINDSEERINYAIELGAKIDSEENSKKPLLRAILLRKDTATKALLAKGANPNFNYQNQKIAHYAIKNGLLNIAKLLISHRSDFSGFNHHGKDAFTYIAFSSSIHKGGIGYTLLEEMIKKGYDLQSNFNNSNLNNNAWYKALIANNSNLVSIFMGDERGSSSTNLLTGANPNQVFTLDDGTTWTPLLIAIKNYELYKANILGTLLMYGKISFNQTARPIPNQAEHNAISYSISTKTSPDVLSLLNTLMDKGANLTEGIRLYLKNGGNPNLQIGKHNERFYTNLLTIAIEKESLDTVKILINEGAEANTLVCHYPIRPMNCNQKHQHTHCDPLWQLIGSHKPLFYALHKTNSSIAEYLLERGASL